MDRTLKLVQARYAIEDVLFRYAEAVDTGDLEALGDVLHGCVMVLPDGRRLQGGAAIAAHYESIIIFYDEAENPVTYCRRACTPRTRHVTTNLLFAFSKAVDSADVRSYFTAYQTLGQQTEIVAGGRYHDHFDFTTSGWQMTERRILVDNLGDMSRHLKTPPA
jgi:3-phenylpropionate/cinnamic acid dioxygenase small subunit